MPYLHRLKKIPRELDRRVKITQEQRAQVKKLFALGLPQREIARRTGVSRRYVSFILFPAKEARCKAQYKERRKDKRYYKRKKHRIAMRTHRRYKQKIKNNLI